MKRLLAVCTAAFLLASPTVAVAQGVGIKAGLSYGNVSNRGVLPGNLHDRTGFAAGIAFHGASPIGIGFEALYAQHGVESATPADSRKIDYIDLPVYLRVGVPVPGFAPFAYAGPQISFELSCHSGDFDCPDTGRPKTTFAGVIGAGFRLGFIGALTLEGRYIYGLTDLKLSTVTSSESYKTRSFMILAGLAM